uniref:YcfA-like protein n=1 Tax=mine drainage metagenome TaxID=410659 RepID=E6QX56_9ZZZZ
MPRKQNDVEKSLLMKGFKAKEGDHNYFNYYSKVGKKTAVFTKTSHGAREIDDNLLSRMAKQCKLSNKDFSLLVDCPLDRDAYEAKLVAQGAVQNEPA